jgi:GTP-binding protein
MSERNIVSAEFVKGIIGSDPILQERKPVVAFVGRSNVGKSSVINSLAGSKDLVRSSSKPGQTQQINYFLINGDTYFADLPGYGYAKLPLKQREKLRKMLLWYLTADEVKLDRLVLVVDSKVGLKDIDYELLETMRARKIPVVIVANKIDRFSQGETVRQVRMIREEAGDFLVLPYSALTTKGRTDLLEQVLL